MSDLHSSSFRAAILAAFIVLVALVAYPFFITRTVFLYRSLAFISFPILIIVAWNGYPLLITDYPAAGSSGISNLATANLAKLPQ
jgi:hypothetical protein